MYTQFIMKANSHR